MPKRSNHRENFSFPDTFEEIPQSVFLRRKKFIILTHFFRVSVTKILSAETDCICKKITRSCQNFQSQLRSEIGSHKNR